MKELRLALTVDDYEAAVAFYRDALGLDELEIWTEGGRGVLLNAGRATIELVDQAHAGTIDRIEVGRRVAGPVRLALEVEDSEAAAEALARAGGELLGGPVETPWRDRNVRVRAPDGMQLTLFTPGAAPRGRRTTGGSSSGSGPGAPESARRAAPGR